MMLARMPLATDDSSLIWDEAPCPLCGREESEIVLEAQDPSSESGLIFSVVRCRDCGLKYTNPRPHVDCIGRFYPSDYKPHRKRPKPPGRPSRLAWLTGHDCPERRGELPMPPGRLLDFGCGSGAFLARMADRGWHVTGLDASPDAVNCVKSIWNLPAFVGSLPHPDLEPGSFDAITMWHSLEHVHEPLDVLRAAFQLLVPGGMLLVACPNIDGLPAKWFGPDWFGLDLPRHLTHFDRQTLAEMLTVAGFRVESLRGVKHSDWIRSSARLAQLRCRAGQLQKTLIWKPMAKLVAWITYAIGSCDSLLVLAKRPNWL